MKALGAALAGLVVIACAPTGQAIAPFPDIPSNGTQTCADRPTALIRAEPNYPAGARESGQAGWVILDYDILPDGTTTNIVVLASSPPDLYDGVARRALREWKFASNAPRQKCRLDFKFNPKPPSSR
jgi:TonB family protein